MQFKDIKIEVGLSIGFCTARRKELINLSDYINEKEWDSLDEDAKTAYIEDTLVKEWANEYIEMYAYRIEE